MPLDAPLTLGAPLRLGPFKVEPDGRLAPSSQDRVPAFRVRWRGHGVAVWLAHGGGERGRLALEAVLGRVPSTGRPEGPGTARRDAAFAALPALRGMLPPGWHLALRPDHRIALETTAELDLPTSADALLTEVTLFLLRLGPYLDLLAEGLAFEPATALSPPSRTGTPG